jgi:hypothetical protein
MSQIDVIASGTVQLVNGVIVVANPLILANSQVLASIVAGGGNATVGLHLRSTVIVGQVTFESIDNANNLVAGDNYMINYVIFNVGDASVTRKNIRNLLNELGGAELQALVADIQDAATNQNIGANLPRIEAIYPALQARGRAIAVDSSMTWAEAETIFRRTKYSSPASVLERYLSPRQPAFDNISSIAGLDIFQNAVTAAANAAQAQIAASESIVDDCMSHLQTFIYPLRFTQYNYRLVGAVPGAPLQVYAGITYGPATASMPDPTGAMANIEKFIANPIASKGGMFGNNTTKVDNEEIWQFPPNCLYQSQIKMKDGYVVGVNSGAGFVIGDDLRENCIVKNFVKVSDNQPSKDYPFDPNYMDLPKGYKIYIRKSDSMAIFVDNYGRALRELPPNILIKIPKDIRRVSNACNFAIGSYVGSLVSAAPNNAITVMSVNPNDNTVQIINPTWASITRPLQLAAAPAQNNISGVDTLTITRATMNTPENAMLLRMLARIAFWRFRAVKSGSMGGSNKMMITNGRTKNRNMNKKQRRSKSKSKSMSMFKSAKRAFYRTNKRNKTSRKY